MSKRIKPPTQQEINNMMAGRLPDQSNAQQNLLGAFNAAPDPFMNVMLGNQGGNGYTLRRPCHRHPSRGIPHVMCGNGYMSGEGRIRDFFKRIGRRVGVVRPSDRNLRNPPSEAPTTGPLLPAPDHNVPSTNLAEQIESQGTARHLPFEYLATSPTIAEIEETGEARLPEESEIPNNPEDVPVPSSNDVRSFNNLFNELFTMYRKRKLTESQSYVRLFTNFISKQEDTSIIPIFHRWLIRRNTLRDGSVRFPQDFNPEDVGLPPGGFGGSGLAISKELQKEHIDEENEYDSFSRMWDNRLGFAMRNGLSKEIAFKQIRYLFDEDLAKHPRASKYLTRYKQESGLVGHGKDPKQISNPNLELVVQPLPPGTNPGFEDAIKLVVDEIQRSIRRGFKGDDAAVNALQRIRRAIGNDEFNAIIRPVMDYIYFEPTQRGQGKDPLQATYPSDDPHMDVEEIQPEDNVVFLQGETDSDSDSDLSLDPTFFNEIQFNASNNEEQFRLYEAQLLRMIQIYAPDGSYQTVEDLINDGNETIKQAHPNLNELLDQHLYGFKFKYGDQLQNHPTEFNPI